MKMLVLKLIKTYKSVFFKCRQILGHTQKGSVIAQFPMLCTASCKRMKSKEKFKAIKVCLLFFLFFLFCCVHNSKQNTGKSSINKYYVYYQIKLKVCILCFCHYEDQAPDTGF